MSVDAVFYLWFEAFPIVFIGIYHFNLGLSGLPFLGFIVTDILTVSLVIVLYYFAPHVESLSSTQHTVSTRSTILHRAMLEQAVPLLLRSV